MANISEERLKEMEEEMSRFEQEISMPEARIPVAKSPHRPSMATAMSPRAPVPSASSAPPPPPPQPRPTLNFIPHQLRHLRPPPPPPRLPMGAPPAFPPRPPPGPLVPPPPLPRLAASYLAPPLPPPPALPQLPEQLQQQPSKPVTTPAAPPTAASSNVIVAAPAVYAAPPMKKSPQPAAPVATEKAEPAPKETKSKSKSSSHKSSEKQKSSEKPSTSKAAEKQTAPAIYDDGSTPKKRKKDRKVVRTAGQQVWEDSSLNEWDPDDFRIFCGDLGNDVTDEVLIRVFGKFPSFLKAKVIRDKRTNKSKGFGFASFKDPQDFIKAMREINGKYVGSRPIKLRKSCWRDRNIEVVRKKTKEKERLGLL